MMAEDQMRKGRGGETTTRGRMATLCVSNLMLNSIVSSSLVDGGRWKSKDKGENDGNFMKRREKGEQQKQG